MDYDATDIASTYDLGREHGPEFLTLWMDLVSSHVKDQHIKTILDLGCGTGRFTEALRARFEAEVIGIDPSEKMLAQARSKLANARIRYETGRAESIPLPDNSVELIFISMIFHHFEDAPLAARECRRVLRDGGTGFVRTGIRERISSYPYVDFFSARECGRHTSSPQRELWVHARIENKAREASDIIRKHRSPPINSMSPFRGFVIILASLPTACAVGY